MKSVKWQMFNMKKIRVVYCATLLGLSVYSGGTDVYANRMPNITIENKVGDYDKIETMLAEYRFEDAIKEIQKQQATAKRRKKPTEALDELLDRANVGIQMLRGTEQVTFIDSMVVDKADFLKAIKIHPESGQIDSYAHFFKKNTSETAQYGTVYLSELGDKVFYAAPNKEGLLHLQTRDKLNQTWGEPMPLSGLEQEHGEQAFPFMLSDGVTLYYAAQNEESMGGFDIFVTRYNSDRGSYLKPENLGFPFNSSANDYLYAIDEVNGLGWFVSDRNQLEGKVCVYVFIPNESRKVYPYDDGNIETIRKAALIHSIRDTWTNRNEVNNGLERLKEAQNFKLEIDRKPDFVFIVNDQFVYTQLAQFKSSEAKSKCSQWKQHAEKLGQLKLNLETLRTQYANANAAQRQQKKTLILGTEREVEEGERQLLQLEKEIRKLELIALGVK